MAGGSPIGENYILPGSITTYGNYAGLGGHWWNGGGSHSTRFNGIFDDVRIYNRPLSEAEIQELYDLTPGPPPVEIGLDLRRFKIRKNKLTGRTVLRLKGLPELPPLDVGDGDEVDARITIELFDIFQDGGDLVIKDERALRVRETEDVFVIRK
jgi:hypothetical protein